MLWPFGAEPFELLGQAVDGHRVQGDKVFLRRDAEKRKRLFWVAMIAGRVHLVRDDPAEVAVTDSFLKTFWQVVFNDLTERRDR